MDTSQESLEFENAKLKFEKADLELNGTVLMLNKACSMYNYVKQYGVDKSFVRMHNEHSELDAMANMIYPCTESFDSYPSDIAKYEQACMEGIMSGIKSAIDYVLKKLKQLGAFIMDLVRKFINLFRHTEEDTKKEAALLAGAAENMSPGEEVKVEENSDDIIKAADKLDEKVQDIQKDSDKIQAVKDYIDQLTHETLQRAKGNQGTSAIGYTSTNQGTPSIGYTSTRKAEQTTDSGQASDAGLHQKEFEDLYVNWHKNINSNNSYDKIPTDIKKVCDEIAGSLHDLGNGTITFRTKSDVIKFIEKGKTHTSLVLGMCDIIDKSDKELKKLIDYYTKQLEMYKSGNKDLPPATSRQIIAYITQCIKYMQLIARRNMKVRSAIILSLKSTGYAYRQIREAIAETDKASKRMKIPTNVDQISRKINW